MERVSWLLLDNSWEDGDHYMSNKTWGHGKKRKLLNISVFVFLEFPIARSVFYGLTFSIIIGINESN
jgi:hypothetical protein